MRVLVDQNLTTRLVQALGDAGVDAVHASSLGLETATDRRVFQACRDETRVLITSDKRLTKFLAADAATSPSVVIVRGTVRGDDAIAMVLSRLDDIGRTISSRGHAVFSIAPNRPTRVQLLPLTH